MTSISKISITFILLVTFSGCAYVERTIWLKKSYQKQVKVIEKQKQCIAYMDQSRNEAGECIVSHWQCLPNQRGQLTVFCASCIPQDTIVSIAFKWNPNWKFIPIRKQSYRLQREEAIYWSDGPTWLSSDYQERYGFLPNIYRQLEYKDATIKEALDPWHSYVIGDFNMTGFQTYGSEEGRYVDAKKEGLWVTKLAAKDSILAFEEKLFYINGAREGRAYHYFGTPPELRHSIPYHDDQVNGWVYVYDEKGFVTDSAYYKNDLHVD